MNKMAALILDNYAEKMFHQTELDIPLPKRGEVLIKVHASGVNPIDTKIRKGIAPYAMPELPAILGTDVAGEIVQLGEGVSNFKIGDQVYGLAGGVRGLSGSLAQYMIADVNLIAIKPTNISMREAAGLPLVFLTAWEGVVDRANIQAGDKLLVNGGAGGVGHMVIQIARIMGAEVFATSSIAKKSIINELGATHIDYHSETIEQYVDKYTLGKGFDIVYDTVGGDALAKVLTATKYYGHITSCAAFGTFDIAKSSLRCATLSAVFVLLPMLTGEKRNHHGNLLRQLTHYVENDQLKVIIDERKFTMNSVLEAHQAVENGSALVKVVIDIA